MKSHREEFLNRHIGVNEQTQQEMLDTLGIQSLDSLVTHALPTDIVLSKKLELPQAKTEHETLQELAEIAKENLLYRSYIGTGYHDCILPSVIKRNILENPGWYTAYTPYQAEIAQGRLEALINFQTMVMDLTGMQIANASLLDEATATAEAMAMSYAVKKKGNGDSFFVADTCHPQTIDVLQTRAEPLGIELVIDSPEDFAAEQRFFGMLLQYPDTNGSIHTYQTQIDQAKEAGILITFAADLLSLVLLVSPGELGADIVVGNSQRFGVPMGYGGPHAAFLATHEKYKRNLPGRLVGVSKDKNGKQAYRLSLQTREQHIRRDKATSNICTAQVLLAVIAAMYAVYHGPNGLKQIAERVHYYTTTLAKELEGFGYKNINQTFFDTLKIPLAAEDLASIRTKALEKKINFRYFQDAVGIALDEVVQEEDLNNILEVFTETKKEITVVKETNIPESLQRTGTILQHPVFQQYHTETEMLRYLRRLEARDLSLTTSMIPLGSCTMKLNSSTEMLPITWPEFSNIHPFVPLDQTKGYQRIFKDLDKWLSEVTGFAAVSLQPNAGSQGEYAGLLAIRRYHLSKGESERNICLIPVSAHGTNPASAVMAGYKVVVVACDKQGNIDVTDLKEKLEKHKENVGSLMITYPSTHGVFEDTIRDICKLVHDYGGQVYMDGANMNAQVGICSPGFIGADVCHLNLHKTFCIPHGGGGPGIGPIGVASHLVPFLPGHSLVDTGHGKECAVSAAPWGSSSIVLISWAYIRMLGESGLTKATQIAILNANYIAKRLTPYYPVLYKGKNDMVAHECIIDVRKFRESAGIEAEDFAKRLMDYGFHAPTMSWPVPGTLMIEPTESESKAELDRFCDAMIAIHQEIEDIIAGKLEREKNPLKLSPHTAETVISDTWELPYSREQAAYPLPYLRQHKFWPYVARIDNAFGDRNLVCSCPPLEDYA
ncbi:MAG: aminomethyl-transferring glycine dehydrogenase [Spirochaetota bacterium]